MCALALVTALTMPVGSGAHDALQHAPLRSCMHHTFLAYTSTSTSPSLERADDSRCRTHAGARTPPPIKGHPSLHFSLAPHSLTSLLHPLRVGQQQDAVLALEQGARARRRLVLHPGAGRLVDVDVAEALLATVVCVRTLD